MQRLDIGPTDMPGLLEKAQRQRHDDLISGARAFSVCTALTTEA